MNKNMIYFTFEISDYEFKIGILNDKWDSSRENVVRIIYIKCYKNASRLNRYIFLTVNAINFLFSPRHTTPFLYGKIHSGVLHLLRATLDTPPGSNPP